MITNISSGTKKKYVDEQDDALAAQISGKAPTNHASSGTTYGVSTASVYGHAMASSTTPKANGTAAVGGVCAVGIDAQYDDEIGRNVKVAIYTGNRIALIRADGCDYGEDAGEAILKGCPEVAGVWEVSQ